RPGPGDSSTTANVRGRLGRARRDRDRAGISSTQTRDERAPDVCAAPCPGRSRNASCGPRLIERRADGETAANAVFVEAVAPIGAAVRRAVGADKFAVAPLGGRTAVRKDGVFVD